MVLRFKADNEGLWTLHCHVLWHAGSGMSMTVQVLGDEEGFVGSDLGTRGREGCGG